MRIWICDSDVYEAGKYYEYQTLVSTKELYIEFGRETFTGKDVINWLPDYDWEINIMPMLLKLVSERVIFVESGVET